MPRVVFLIDSLGWGGAERLLLQYMPHLRSEGFEPVVCAMHERSGNPVAEEIGRLGIPVETVPVERLRDRPRSRGSCATCAVAAPTSCTPSSSSPTASASVAARLAGLPSLSTLHTMYESPRWSRSWWRNRLGDLALGGLATAIICVSDEAHRHYEAHRPYPRRKLVTLRNGIDLARFEAAAGEGPAVRRELGIAAGAPVLASVSVLRRDKGIQHMIAALPRVAAEVPGVVYLVVGDGEHRAALEAAAAEDGVADRSRVRRQPHGRPARAVGLRRLRPSHPARRAPPPCWPRPRRRGCRSSRAGSAACPRCAWTAATACSCPPGTRRRWPTRACGCCASPGWPRGWARQGREVARERYDIRTQAARLCDLYRRAMAR